jgi:hypothetical protein
MLLYILFVYPLSHSPPTVWAEGHFQRHIKTNGASLLLQIYIKKMKDKNFEPTLRSESKAQGLLALCRAARRKRGFTPRNSEF